MWLAGLVFYPLPIGMSLPDVRAYEKRMQDETNKVVLNSGRTDSDKSTAMS